MIRVEYVDGLACPVIRGDGCGERITDPEMAGVAWPLAGPDGDDWPRWGDAPSLPKFLCKTNHCLSTGPHRHWPGRN